MRLRARSTVIALNQKSPWNTTLTPSPPLPFIIPLVIKHGSGCLGTTVNSQKNMIISKILKCSYSENLADLF